MLSRVADTIYWLARYMERTQTMLQTIRIQYIASQDEPLYRGWEPLLYTYGDLSEEELAQFEALIEVPDRDLFRWLTGEDATPENYDTPVYRRLQAFHRHDAPIHS